MDEDTFPSLAAQPLQLFLVECAELQLLLEMNFLGVPSFLLDAADAVPEAAELLIDADLLLEVLVEIIEFQTAKFLKESGGILDHLLLKEHDYNTYDYGHQMVDSFSKIEQIMPRVFDLSILIFFCIVFIEEHLSIAENPITIRQHEKWGELKGFQSTFIQSVVIERWLLVVPGQAEPFAEEVIENAK